MSQNYHLNLNRRGELASVGHKEIGSSVVWKSPLRRESDLSGYQSVDVPDGDLLVFDEKPMDEYPYSYEGKS